MAPSSAGALRITRAYYAIAGIYTGAAALIWGVNTLFLLAAGLDLFQVFVANAAYTAANVLFEIPTGIYADLRGRRASFLAGTAILVIGTLGFVVVDALDGGVLPFMLISAGVGLGFTFYSGAVEAWLVDALRSVGAAERLEPVFARGAMITGSAMLVGSLLGGLLGDLHLALPYVVRAGLLGVVAILAWRTMHDEGFDAPAADARGFATRMAAAARHITDVAWSIVPVRILVVASFLRWSFLLWGFYAWQPHLLGLLGREDAVWIAGVVSAAISLASIGGNLLVEKLRARFRRRSTLLIVAGALQGIGAIGVGLAPDFWSGLAMLLLVTASVGLYQPIKQAYLHGLVDSRERASLISFDSLVANLGGFSGQLGLGYLSRVQGIPAGYLAGALPSFLALPVILWLRKVAGDEDRIPGKPPSS